jgi:hypothetical protein
MVLLKVYPELNTLLGLFRLQEKLEEVILVCENKIPEKTKTINKH